MSVLSARTEKSMDEGVVKYRCDWEEADPVAAQNIADLMHWRDRLHAWGLIGVYENGIGFGNVSVRLGNSCQFVISGTQTAHLRTLDQNSTVLLPNLTYNKISSAAGGPYKLRRSP